jgi:hypothetical protein
MTSIRQTLDALVAERSAVRYDISLQMTGQATLSHVPASLADIARIAGSGWETIVHGLLTENEQALARGIASED